MTAYSPLDATGVSGTRYKFQLYALGTTFLHLPGVYAFVKQSPNGKWDVLYIGQSHDLEQRVGGGLATHHKITDAVRRGATHIAVMGVQGREADRLRVESDLCQAYSPACNGTLTDTVSKLLRGI